MTQTTTDATMPARRIRLGVAALMMAMLLAMLDNAVVATALPRIVDELGTLSQLAWVVTAYTLGTATATPIWGKLADLYGRKPVFLAAVALFLLASTGAGAAPSMVVLVALRAGQGIAAGGMMVAAMAIIADLVPPQQRGRYLGLMTAVMPVAMISGPVVGGLVTDTLGWRWVFWINLPLAAATLAIAARLRLPHQRTGRGRLDLIGAGLLTIGLVAFTLTTTLAGKGEWLSAPILILAALALLTLAGFVFWQRRAAEPIVPPALFASTTFTIACALGFLTGAVMFSAVTFIPQFLQNVRQESATGSGLLLLPFMLGMVTASIATGQLLSRGRTHCRRYAVAGSIVLTSAAASLIWLDTASNPTVTSIKLTALGVGIGLLTQPIMVLSQNSVPPQMIGVAMGTSTLFRTLGSSLGIAALGTVCAAALGTTQQHGPNPTAIVQALHWVFGLTAALAAATIILSLALRDRPQPDRRDTPAAE